MVIDLLASKDHNNETKKLLHRREVVYHAPRDKGRDRLGLRLALDGIADLRKLGAIWAGWPVATGKTGKTLMLNLHKLGSRCVKLLDDDRLCDLGPGTPNQEVYATLAELDARDLFGDRPVIDPQMAAGCLSGMWLLHDFLDPSHTMSQGRVGAVV